MGRRVGHGVQNYRLVTNTENVLGRSEHKVTIFRPSRKWERKAKRLKVQLEGINTEATRDHRNRTVLKKQF